MMACPTCAHFEGSEIKPICAAGLTDRHVVSVIKGEVRCGSEAAIILGGQRIGKTAQRGRMLASLKALGVKAISLEQSLKPQTKVNVMTKAFE